MDNTVHTVTLDQKPCVVHYLEHLDRFIVGTYELFLTIEDARLNLNLSLDDDELRNLLDKINNRAGKLILLNASNFSNPSIEYEFECQGGGGIFDAKIRYNNLDSSYTIFAAHSNGTVGIYKVSSNPQIKISLQEHINTLDSKMLTTIDIFPEHHNNTSDDNLQRRIYSSQTSINSLGNRMVVGDASGYITIIGESGIMRLQPAENDDSIWVVKCLRLSSGRDVIFVGSESVSWQIFGFDEHGEQLVLLYENKVKDFFAGITSITILEHVQSIEYDLIEVLVGSYDETLQFYQVKMNHDGRSQGKPQVCHKNKMRIKNGGIWRVKPFRSSNNNKKKRKQLCIAAMYAGLHVLTLELDEKEPPTKVEKLNQVIDPESLNFDQKPLHYDVDISSSNTTICVADFNNSLCLIKTIDQ